MDVDTILQGGGLVISGAAVMKLGEAALKAWSARNQKTEIAPDPLNVRNEKKPVYVTVGECNRRMCEQAERIERIESEVKQSNAAVIAKLDTLDQRSEERAQATHRRLDPFVQELGAVRGKVESMERRLK